MTKKECQILMDLMIGRALRMRATGDYVTVEELKKILNV